MREYRHVLIMGAVAAVAFAVYVVWISAMVRPALAAEAQEILPTDSTIVGLGRSYETIAANATGTLEFDPGGAATVDVWELLYVGIHMDAAMGGDIIWTISVDSGLGAAYDVALNPGGTTISTGGTDLLFQPTATLLFDDADKLDLVSNTTPTAGVGVQMMWRGGK